MVQRQQDEPLCWCLDFFIAVLIGLVVLVFWGVKDFLPWCTESTGGRIFLPVCACGFAYMVYALFHGSAEWPFYALIF